MEGAGRPARFLPRTPGRPVLFARHHSRGFSMSYSHFAFIRILGIAFLIVAMGCIVDRYLAARHRKLAKARLG